MEIIGQKNLKTKLDSYSITEFPKTILFIGEQGCGKKLLAKHTADRLGLEFVELEEKVTNEDLEIFESNTYPTMYFINLDLFSDKQQNSFLKFIEEPVANVYVVLGCESETTVLHTILSRCIKFKFEGYSKEELVTICGDESLRQNALLYEVFYTPGKIKRLTDESFLAMYDFAYKIITKVHLASYGNTLINLTKVNFKEEFHKIDFLLLFDTLEYIAMQELLNGSMEASDAAFEIFKITKHYKQLAVNKRLLKEFLFINYLTALWEATHK